MHSFFVSDVGAQSITLSAEESKHAVKVLRLKEGSLVELFDGNGLIALAEITVANQKSCLLRVVDREEKKSKTAHVHIAIAPTKNMDRLEWFLEKATEIGVSEITPLLCEHSERKVIKPERLEKIIVSALKQSHQAYLPKLNGLTPIDDFLSGDKNEELLFIAHCCENVHEKQDLKDLYKLHSSVVILIGPEGDFSPEEVKRAKENGFQEISLGNSRLRTETAGVVACHTIQLLNS